MRSRSGAIHSDSAEDFLIMAELAHSKNGIFYDESTNKKIMNEIEKTHKNKPNHKKQNNKSPQNDSQDHNVFKDFNFNTQSEQTYDQLQELNKKDPNISKVITLGIVTPSLIPLKERIQEQMGLKLDSSEQDRYLDLLVIHRQQLLFKIWMFRENSSQQQHLLNTYISRCQMLYKQRDGKCILQSSEDPNYEWIIQNYLSFLEQ